MTLPTWLADQLIDAGDLTPHRVSRRARTMRCPWCSAYVQAAIDDLGFESFTHPAPTTPAGELAAVLAGRRMHTLVAGELVHRGEHRITAKSADEEMAFPAHECGSEMTFPVSEKYVKRRKAAWPKDDDPIPF